MPIAAIRFNNPFNISLPKSGYFGGSVVGIVNQPGYASFPNMATGYAAGANRVTQYISGQTSYGNLNTIGALGPVYAQGPGSAGWAQNVSQISGIPINQPLDPTNAGQMSALNQGILTQEIGAGNAQQFTSLYGNNQLANGPVDAGSGFNQNSDVLSGGTLDPAGPVTGPDPNAPADLSGGTVEGFGTGASTQLSVEDPSQFNNTPNIGTVNEPDATQFTPADTGTGGTNIGTGGAGGAGGGSQGGGSQDGSQGAGAGGGGGELPINLKTLGPGTTKPIGDWIKEIMSGFGQETDKVLGAGQNAVANYFGGISNWFVRAFLIFLGIVLVAIGLIVLMWDHGGEQVATKVMKVAKL
jgi:hypothetical protein